jgi:uncharacterized delta-60 repeat protein
MFKPWRQRISIKTVSRSSSHRRSRSRCVAPRLELLEDRTLLNAGDLDPTFGTGGKVLTDFVGPIDASAAATVIQPHGKIVVAGTGILTNENLPYRDFLLARYNPDGSLDATFGNSGLVNTEFFGYGQYQYRQAVSGLAVGPDGKIVVIGAHQGSSTLLFGVARYTANGVLDPTFGGGGTVATVVGVPTGVVIQPDNKIIVVGNMLQPNGSPEYAIVARFNIDGSLDSTFGTGGEIVASNTSAEAVALQIDGKIIVVGAFSSNSFSFNSSAFIERFNPNGSPDSGFNTGALATLYTSVANGVVLQGDGRILITCPFGYPTAPKPFLVRLNSDGTIDTTFGNNGHVVEAVSATGIALQSDGSLDSTFGSGGIAALAISAAGLLIQGDGKIVVVGGGINFAAERLDSNGAIDTTFGTGGQVTTGFNGTIASTADSVVIQTDGKIIVAGSAANEVALVRYNPDGSLDTAFGTGGKVTTDVGFSSAEGFGFGGTEITLLSSVCSPGSPIHFPRMMPRLSIKNTVGQLRTFQSSGTFFLGNC